MNISERFFDFIESDREEEETLDSYNYLFESKIKRIPELEEALELMFKNNGVEKNEAKKLTMSIKLKIDEKITDETNTYPLDKKEAKIISSYTYEFSEEKYKKYNPYKLVNKNLVEDNRLNGLEKILEYFYIFLKALRKLKNYESKDKNLYRGIKTLVNIDPNDPKSYKKDNIKTFWGFTSTSRKREVAEKFLDDKEGGTLFILSGPIIGYEISKYSCYKEEEEILLEPERKLRIIKNYKKKNNIIIVECHFEKNKTILEDIFSNTIKEKNDEKDELKENYTNSNFKTNKLSKTIKKISNKYIIIPIISLALIIIIYIIYGLIKNGKDEDYPICFGNYINKNVKV